ncbi:hypothetical protein IV203_037639 [Nitzschia inconspicua]|uniref:C3H1-type domain-containing protein n=1 Tax=Nitzschia inconspicua TaxID=303405 RepID=A0A9K3PYB3_9STRA|nr:hypothetical protein IV203_037639 [Nitzschia inconspicua]
MEDISIDGLAVHHTFGGEQEKNGGDANIRSIVCAESPGQNFAAWGSVLEPTANNFAEHRKTDTIMSASLPRDDDGGMGTFEQQQHHYLPQHHNEFSNIISHQPTSSPLPSPFFAVEGGDSSIRDINNQGLSWGTGGHSTTRSGSSRFGSDPKPAESAIGLMTGRTQHESTVQHLSSNQQPQYKPQNHQSSLTLLLQQPPQQLSRPPIQQHTATAAEIALGLPSSLFNQNDQEMGDGTRTVVYRNSSLDRVVEAKQDSKTGDSSSSNTFFPAKDGDEETSRTEDTLLVNSSGRMTPLHDSSEHGSDLHRLAMVVGTPSTVSTAPSSDDASLGTDYKLDDSMLPNLLHPLGMHRRESSWGEEGLLPSSAGFITPPREFPNQNPWLTPPAPSQRQQNSQQRAWGSALQPRGPPQYPPQQQRIASFRHEVPWSDPISTIQPQQQQAPYSHQHVVAYQQLPSQPPSQQLVQPGHQQPPQGSRKQSYAHQAAQHEVQHTVPTPISAGPKNPRQPRSGARQTPPANQVGGQHPPSTNSRSASEILKTLLRKKACLYEPDTSRSVALVTWLVGRVLALEHGFFSRQQLQSGVHACVANKIESGTITRTKVNRCMQIILNSCFHYIIPRSDGTEENGDHFRALFGATVRDDSELIQYLPEPWNDLRVDPATVLEASLHDSDDKTTSSSCKSPSATPKSSPKLSSVNAEKSPDRDSQDDDKDDSKRAVLLCFNENVRSAEDVFRCHNEFIRDTANAAHLQLTAQEWRQFFGRETSRAPYLWGSVGIPTLTGESAAGPPRRPDLLGQMSKEEVSQFRSTWCTKRYEHDHDLCGFAHVEVNGGWLRRNPLIHSYKDEMCKFISTAGDKLIGPSHFFLNECAKGIHCDHAHSMEEIIYHPNRYKTKVCNSLYSQSRGCRSGDVCPNLHPPDVTKPMRKAEMLRSQGGRRSKHEQSHAGSKPSVALPRGSPVVYASPAPFSSFDQLLGMPGLQSIFRRQSSVIRAHIRSPGKARCLYSPFGDDWGVSVALPSPESQGESVHLRGNS